MLIHQYLYSYTSAIMIYNRIQQIRHDLKQNLDFQVLKLCVQKSHSVCILKVQLKSTNQLMDLKINGNENERQRC